MKRFLALIALSSLFFSCQEWKVDAVKTDINELKAVNCLLSPADSVVRVDVYRVQEVLSEPKLNTDLSVADAEVVLSESDKSYKLHFDASKGYYLSDPGEINIEAGKTYHLEVRVNDKLFSSSTTVPKAPVKVGSGIEQTTGQSEERIYFKVNWEDPDSNEYSYLVLSEARSGLSSGSIAFSNGQGGYGNFIESPKGLQSEFELKGSSFIFSSSNSSEETEITIFIYSANSEFKEMVDDTYRGIGNIESEIGLFERFQNPANRFSNIEGGHGVFAAYNPLILNLSVE
jgi:hypothetical protein